MQENDPAKLYMYGSIKQDLKEAYSYLKKAANLGSINAKFNLGSLHLLGETISLPKSAAESKLHFSFSKAY